MDLFIKDNLKIITFMVLVFINGLMEEYMMENGKITKCMEEGKFTFKDKKEYDGQYFEDVKHGFGIMKFNDGT